MAKSVKNRLSEAIETAIESKTEKTADAIAKKIVEDEKDLVQQWALEKITAMIRAVLKAVPDASQLQLPFKDLTRSIPFGKREVQLGAATISILKKSIVSLRKRAGETDPKVARMQELIKSMTPLARKTRGLTVARYYELMAERHRVQAEKRAAVATATPVLQ